MAYPGMVGHLAFPAFCIELGWPNEETGCTNSVEGEVHDLLFDIPTLWDYHLLHYLFPASDLSGIRQGISPSDSVNIRCGMQKRSVNIKGTMISTSVSAEKFTILPRFGDYNIQMERSHKPVVPICNNSPDKILRLTSHFP